MKKIVSLLLLCALALGLLAGCGSSPAADPSSDGKLRIVTTIFPIYDWVRNILGQRSAEAEVTLLLGKGVDLHSYQPTAEDMVRISSCDVFIHVGGESDDWVEDALKEAVNRDMTVISLLDVLGSAVKEEELVEGMEHDDHDHHEDDDHEHHEGEEHEHEEAEYDEHVWLSLKHAVTLCQAISDALGRADPAGREVYAAGAAAYIEKLKALDEDFQSSVDSAAFRTVLFADRFPFRYLTDDYGLEYYAAFSGCSAETEASFDTVIFLAGKLDELGLPAVLQIESSDGSIARTVVENTRSRDQQILTLDSMQSTTAAEAAETGYLSVMEQNLETLKAALG